MEGKVQAVTMGGSLMHSGTAVEESKATLPTDRQPDFSGWATKFGLVCSDGRTITKDAFAHQDSTKVPLVWQHTHDDPENILGHAFLEQRDEGVYAYGFFNETPSGQHAKQMVEHGDINQLSIFANKLKEQGKNVLHGIIRELSLVMAGANPGAMIDNLALQHGDGTTSILDDEAIIYTGEELEHAATSEGDGPTVQEVYDAMDDDQKAVVHYMVSEAISTTKAESKSVTHGALPPKQPTPTITHSDSEGGRRMSRNVFEKNGGASGGSGEQQHVLTHDAMREIAQDALNNTKSLKASMEAYALKHGIENLDVLFPDAKSVDATPQFDKRRTEWVAPVLNGVGKRPFSRIKSMIADITHEQARARGYIKGNFKKEEWFSLSKRTTGPTTVYKKQKLDRDDIIDITDLDVVAFMKAEMRLMLDEELARAVLIGDGRAVDDEDKIRDPAGVQDGLGIRSILNDHELYAASIYAKVNLATDAGRTALIEQIIMDMGLYKGSGSPTFYTTRAVLTNLLLTKDGMGRRLYNTKSDLAAAMLVNDIVAVEVMEDVPSIYGIIVNLSDYVIGADRGGEVSLFDDFDIDYNQLKYLIETRVSGALVKIRSALVVRVADPTDTLVDPADPTFTEATGALVVPNTAGVVYRRTDTNAVVTNTTITVPAGGKLTITAEPDATHYFDNNVEDSWDFSRPVA